MQRKVSASAKMLEKSASSVFSKEIMESMRAYVGLPKGAHAPLTVKAAIQIVALMACSDVISQDISKATCRLMQHTSGGGRRVVLPREHPVSALLARKPNNKHSWGEFFEILIRYLVITQNAYVAVRRGLGGAPEEMIPVITNRVSYWVNPETGDDVYFIARGTNFERAQLRKFGTFLVNDEMIHFRGRMIDTHEGYSSLLSGASTLALSKALTDYLTKMFANDGRQSGVFTTKEQFGSDEKANSAFRRLKEDLREAWANSNAYGVPILLEAGLDFKAIAADNNDNRSTEIYEQQAAAVASMYRVPQHKIGLTKGVKYENIDKLDDNYLSDCLIPVAKRVEERLRLSMLSDDEQLDYFFEFDRNEMIAADAATTNERVKTGAQTGALSIDEQRRLLGMDPLPNDSGKTRTIPVAMTLVDEKNQIVLNAGGNEKIPTGGATSDGDKPVKPKLAVVGE